MYCQCKKGINFVTWEHIKKPVPSYGLFQVNQRLILFKPSNQNQLAGTPMFLSTLNSELKIPLVFCKWQKRIKNYFGTTWWSVQSLGFESHPRTESDTLERMFCQWFQKPTPNGVISFDKFSFTMCMSPIRLLTKMISSHTLCMTVCSFLK